MVDTVYWLPIQAGLQLKLVGLVQRSAATWRRFCIHHVNRVNSHSGCAATIDSTINIVVIIIIIITIKKSVFKSRQKEQDLLRPGWMLAD